MREVVDVVVDGPGDASPGVRPPRTFPVERPEWVPIPPISDPLPPDDAPPPRVPPVSDPLPATLVRERDHGGSGASGSNGGGFEVNPAVITGAAGVFDAESTALVDGATTAAARLATLGAPWGDDRVGARFGSTYQPAAERVMHNVAALGAGLTRIAAALRAVGASYQSVDDGIAAAVEAYAARLDSAAHGSKS